MHLVYPVAWGLESIVLLPALYYSCVDEAGFVYKQIYPKQLKWECFLGMYATILQM